MKQSNACSLDTHGLACQSQKLADKALEAAYEAGVLDERKRIIDQLWYNIQELGIYELYEDIIDGLIEPR